MKSYAYLFLFTLLFSFSCSDSTPNFDAENEAAIIKYIADNNLNATKSNTGLYYIIDNKGTGNTPTPTSNVTVAYKGAFLSGKVFDESKPTGIAFNLQGVIKGWTEGITYFKEGGNGTLIVPSRLGYGDSGRGSIPGGAVLVFDISLLKVN